MAGVLGGNEFSIIQCDIICDIPRKLVKVHTAKQTRNRIDNVIDKRGDNACERAADDDTNSHIHHISLADKLLKFFKKLLHYLNTPLFLYYFDSAVKK